MSADGNRRPRPPVLVLGLLPAGLALARSLGRAGIPVYGGAFRPNEFGLRSRYLRATRVAAGATEGARDTQILEFLREIAGGGRAILVPERDEHVDFVVRNWNEVHELAEVPLPPEPEIVRRLRRKDLLPVVAAEAGVAAPATVPMQGPQTVADGAVAPPFLLKPVEGQEYALAFGKKAVVAESQADAVAVWQEAQAHGFELVVQELVPDSHERVYSLFTYISRDGEPLANVVGRKVRQGPLRFGTSAVFETKTEPTVLSLGLRLLESVGYRGFAHVEFALDSREGAYKVLEVNTRLPVWAGIAMGPTFDIARIAYEDLSDGTAVAHEPLAESLTWVYLAKDLWVSAQMAKRRELSVRDFLAQHVRTGKVGAVFALDDPLPALASVAYLRSRL